MCEVRSLVAYLCAEVKVKQYLILMELLFCLFFTNLSQAADIEVGKDIFRMLLQAGITDNNFKGTSELGRKLCESYKGESCYSVSSLPEGICRAAKGSSCYSVSSIGEALCKAGDGSSCYSVSNIGQGFCKMMHASSCYSVSSIEEGICKGLGGSSCYSPNLSRLEPRDVSWAWDEFTVPNAAGRIWACRGIQTGQFAEDSKCSGWKEDRLWPND